MVCHVENINKKAASLYIDYIKVSHNTSDSIQQTISQYFWQYNQQLPAIQPATSDDTIHINRDQLLPALGPNS